MPRSMPSPRPMLALACSATKRSGAGEMPAIDRYDGPLWRTLRSALRETRADVDIWFLSARYGFQPAALAIADYEQVLTPARAAELLRLPTSNHAPFRTAALSAGPILLAGGQLYRDTMRRAIGVHLPDMAETAGGGIGHHRAALRSWIQERDHARLAA